LALASVGRGRWPPPPRFSRVVLTTPSANRSASDRVCSSLPISAANDKSASPLSVPPSPLPLLPPWWLWPSRWTPPRPSFSLLVDMILLPQHKALEPRYVRTYGFMMCARCVGYAAGCGDACALCRRHSISCCQSARAFGLVTCFVGGLFRSGNVTRTFFWLRVCARGCVHTCACVCGRTWVRSGVFTLGVCA
jgi:hypothetical protein